MATARNLLVELLVEELPPRALRRLGEAFADGIFGGLQRRRFLAGAGAGTAFATPRRLAARVTAVLDESMQQELVVPLLPASIAFDAMGRPTAAFRKRAQKEGMEALVDAWPDAQDGPAGFYVASDGKIDRVYSRVLAGGQPLARGLAETLDETIRSLPIPKVMRYQLADGWTSVDFVRPAHRLVALHGADVVPVSALGLQAGRETLGHRFEAGDTPIELRDADSYEEQLRTQGAVIASFSERRDAIARQLQDAATREGLRTIDDEALLDEVTALVERPNVLVCRFDERFLAVPAECLILTMKANQKYFPLLDGSGRLTNRFLVVGNVSPADASNVVSGNERVVRPRLADAKFFFDHDRQRTLESRLPGLDKVVYHNRLGSQRERVERVRTIARAIGEQLDGPSLAALADRAALLAKADLLTDMVGEFPELQGVMGGYYARHDGEADAVAFAIEDHYRPRFAGDALPRGPAGTVLALADKLETLAGMFGIGQLPSGDKDPFALRRHALGVVRMLIERDLPLSLPRLLAVSFEAFPAGHRGAHVELNAFLRERLVGYLRDAGYSAQEVDAVVEARPDCWAEFPKRLAAVRAFAALPEAASLAAANKRVANILKKSDGSIEARVDDALLSEPAEAALYSSLRGVAPQAERCFDAGDYAGSLRTLAALKAPVDAFFDHVLVNAENAALRANRLGLLAILHAAMNRVADLSKLAA